MGSKSICPVDLKRIKISDSFWGREQELVRREVIPYQWEALNDRVSGAAPSWCMHNFRAAARLVKKKKAGGVAFKAPEYTFRGFEAVPEDPAHPDPDAFYGFVFQDTDLSKWIEAVAYTLTQHPDPELEKLADGAIDLVCAAQWENGYLDTYYIINGLDRAFTNLRDHHELYCMGHLIEGAVAYAQATGKRKLLDAACRFADYAVSCFGPGEGQKKGYPGHEIAEMALVRLYEATGHEQYLDLAKFFLDQRGTEPHYFAQEERERYLWEHGKNALLPPGLRETRPSDYIYSQAHMPVREQAEAVGHAVRAGYLYSGMADVARLTGERELLDACKRIWKNIVSEKLYITGGVGGTNYGESFSYPYDLPNNLAYSETCAAIALAFFARRMLEIEPRREYADVMELALYNTVLAGMALDGKSFFYVNPLEVDPAACHLDPRKGHVQPVRQKWFGCACCPPNLARIVSSIGAYAYTESADTLWVHLYMGSRVTKRVGDGELVLQVKTEFPWEGTVQMEIEAAPETACTLAFRIPGWSRGGRAEILRAGESRIVSWTDAGPSEDDSLVSFRDGYLYVYGVWQTGDGIRLTFPMEVRMVSANTRVREDAGKVAFTRGPITFCAEEADNGKNLHLIRVAPICRPEHVKVEMTETLGRPMAVLKIPAKRQLPSVGGLYIDYTPPVEEGATLTMIPYYAWANRGEGEMAVWIRI